MSDIGRREILLSVKRKQKELVNFGVTLHLYFRIRQKSGFSHDAAQLIFCLLLRLSYDSKQYSVYYLLKSESKFHYEDDISCLKHR